MKNDLTIFEDYKIRRLYDEEKEKWFFSVVDIMQVLLQQPDYQTTRKYWNKLKERLKNEGSEVVTNCHQLKLPEEWSDVNVKQHKKIKGLKTQNLRDHMSEAELIFTALAELSTRQIAESIKATGLEENKEAGKQGGGIAKKARLELERKTGKKVVSSENYLPSPQTKSSK